MTLKEKPAIFHHHLLQDRNIPLKRPDHSVIRPF
jgi:hypothetical protein